MIKKRLLTVTGSRIDTLSHMLNHYNDLVDEIFIVVYEWENFSTYDKISEIILDYPKAKIIKKAKKEKYNWEYVTELYNEIKNMFPNDWWIIADDDEFHIYSKDLNKIISDCEYNGWDIVRGGFIDRIGIDGMFPVINQEHDIFHQFPLAGFQIKLGSKTNVVFKELFVLFGRKSVGVNRHKKHKPHVMRSS